jgi:hypothetical protein
LCGDVLNPDLFHILSNCKHGGPATILDRHDRVAGAVRKAIERENPEDKTILDFCPNLQDGRRLPPDITCESAKKDGRGSATNTYHLVEIATPWSYEGVNVSALNIAYQKKVRKHQPLIANIERLKPGYKVGQTTIIVSLTGALLTESLEELANVELDCEVGEDEEVEGASQYEVPEELKPGMAQELEGIEEDVPPIEKYHASVLAHEAAVEDRRMPPEIEEHPDRHKSSKARAKMERELSKVGMATRAKEEHDRCADREAPPKICGNFHGNSNLHVWRAAGSN